MVESEYLTYPTICKWIERTLVYGDSHAIFMDLIDKQAVRIVVQKIGIIIYDELTKKDNNWSCGYIDIFIMNCCPFPGFIKKPSGLDLDIYDYNALDMIGLFKAIEQDGGSKCIDLMKLYYQDADSEEIIQMYKEYSDED